MELAPVAMTLACHSSSFAFRHDFSLDNVKAQEFPGLWRYWRQGWSILRFATGKHALRAGYTAGLSSLSGLSLPVSGQWAQVSTCRGPDSIRRG